MDKNLPTSVTARHSKIYQNWDFWFENIPSGNRGYNHWFQNVDRLDWNGSKEGGGLQHFSFLQ
jgi:hypothetical protein